jgi:predicted MPP superfamily phosphohydrolase
VKTESEKPRRSQQAGLAKRTLFITLMSVAVFTAVFIYRSYQQALRDPIVRTAEFREPGWPADSPPFRILLVSDMHVQEPDMPPARLERILRQLNRLQPDVTVVAGDFGHSSRLYAEAYGTEQITKPLRLLRASMGVFAVLGNHDRGNADEIRSALQALGITVLKDQAVQIGPLVLGGIFTRPGRTMRRLRALDGIRILVAHSPKVFPEVSPEIQLTLAGHTHCGQIVLPFVGALATGTAYGERLRCGRRVEAGRHLIVTAGLGTSNVPLRVGAPPDVWLITIGP